MGSSCQHPDGCNKPARRTGQKYCSAHAERLRLHGSLGPAEIRTRPNPRQTFETLLTVDSDDCILWPHARTTAGYGVLRIDGRLIYAHRMACERTYGPPTTDRREAAHSCHVRACMNPRHLRWATSAENSADMVAAGRAHGRYS